MRKAFALAGATVVLALSAGLSAQAGEVATRCSNAGCDRIDCNDTGDRCVRSSDYDSYYDGYTNGYDNNGSYGGYYGGNGAPYDNGYGSSGYGNYRAPYDNGYYGGYAGRLVCDNAGSRCYRSNARYWSYREYYRLHGYRWQDRDDRE